MSRLRFGLFMAPFHVAGDNPTYLIRRDLDLIDHLDRLGFDEVWVGEHHSAGTEIISCPELIIAAAAERTQNIKLGTGVVSLAYHNPLWVADRMVQLDHMTRGRAMFGVGPGSLPSDSAMIGLTPTECRELLEVKLDVCMRLFRGETVTADVGTHKLVNARLQLAPYSDPLFDVAVAAVASPTGARLAGKYGVGLLSIGATMAPGGFDALAYHWDIVNERAEANGLPPVDRSQWRLVGLMHIAETKEQAYRDVEFGIEAWFQYFQQTAAFPQMPVVGADVKEMIDFVNASGVGVIGTPDDAKEQVQRLVTQSNGGFGALVLLSHDWANPQATWRSYELIAQRVAPEFQGQSSPTLRAKQSAAESREEWNQAQFAALDHMGKKYAAERGG